VAPQFTTLMFGKLIGFGADVAGARAGAKPCSSPDTWTEACGTNQEMAQVSFVAPSHPLGLEPPCLLTRACSNVTCIRDPVRAGSDRWSEARKLTIGLHRQAQALYKAAPTHMDAWGSTGGMPVIAGTRRAAMGTGGMWSKADA
jgi:hypothetical protein